MRVALGAIHEVTDEVLRFVKQLGVNDIIVHTPPLRGDGYYEFLDLLHLRQRVKYAGLRLAAIENVPSRWYDRILRGMDGRNEQIENWCKTLTNMGKAGIPALGYHWMMAGVWRTSTHFPERGGAFVTGFDYDLVKTDPLRATRYMEPPLPPVKLSERQMWENFTHFLKKVVPIAEEVGVKMGLHPDDPPVSPLGGTTRIFTNVDAFKRMIEIVESDCNGIEFCQGTFTEMGADIPETIRYFGKRKKILYVHFRNVKGSVPKFHETFIDDGDVDMFEAMKAYKEVGFDGPLIADHVPRMIDDTPWGHRGRAYAIGYMRALMQVVDQLASALQADSA